MLPLTGRRLNLNSAFEVIKNSISQQPQRRMFQDSNMCGMGTETLRDNAHRTCDPPDAPDKPCLELKNL